MQLLHSHEGKPQMMVFNNFVYERDCVRKFRVYWRCIDYYSTNCRARLISGDGRAFVHGEGHNHEPHTPKLQLCSFSKMYQRMECLSRFGVLLVDQIPASLFCTIIISRWYGPHHSGYVTGVKISGCEILHVLQLASSLAALDRISLIGESAVGGGRLKPLSRAVEESAMTCVEELWKTIIRMAGLGIEPGFPKCESIIRAFTSHQGDPGSILGESTLGVLHKGIMPDDDAVFRCCFIPTSFHPHWVLRPLAAAWLGQCEGGTSSWLFAVAGCVPGPMHYVMSKKGKLQLVLGDAVYEGVSSRASKTFWRCKQYYSRGCRSRVAMVSGVVVSIRGMHNHDPACQPRPSLLDTCSRRLPFRWSRLPLLVLYTSELNHLLTHQLQLNSLSGGLSQYLYCWGDHLEGHAEVQLLQNPQGNPVMLIDGYAHSIDFVRNKRMYWKCLNARKLRCRARLISKDGKVVRSGAPHSHLPQTLSRCTIFLIGHLMPSQIIFVIGTGSPMFIWSRRGNRQLVVNNFIYKRNEVGRLKTYWICTDYHTDVLPGSHGHHRRYSLPCGLRAQPSCPHRPDPR
ncbi:hypothetical protein PR048_032468 [Dryococelus australis]|uniref:FLYWCH-type domain-containing protein n=1 Tax=Dryococelus australis TaxID=614101 RepID=A0ABQ9G5F4_9NEOP|nr:hypothetical protein PR048_032468 [Dryococelus australis]